MSDEPEVSGSAILEKTFSLAAKLAAVCYVIGLLVENVHLATLGLTNFDLVRARYILIGACWFFLLFVAYLLVHLLGIRRRKTSENLRLCAFIFCVAQLMVFQICSGFDLQDLRTSYIAALILRANFGLVSLGFGSFCIAQSIKKLQKSMLTDPRPASSLRVLSFDKIEAILPVMGVLCSLYAYAIWLFPLVPQYVGGGKPTVVTLYIKPDKTSVFLRAEMLQEAFHMGSDAQISRVLLFDTETDGFVVTPQGSPIAFGKGFRISKELVDIVVYDPSFEGSLFDIRIKRNRK